MDYPWKNHASSLCHLLNSIDVKKISILAANLIS